MCSGVHHVGPGAARTRREHQYPGNIGSQKLSPRKSKVADKATATSIPTMRSINTDVASNTVTLSPSENSRKRTAVTVTSAFASPHRCNMTNAPRSAARASLPGAACPVLRLVWHAIVQIGRCLRVASVAPLAADVVEQICEGHDRQQMMDLFRPHPLAGRGRGVPGLTVCTPTLVISETFMEIPSR